jgi:hypothetical protein
MLSQQGEDALRVISSRRRHPNDETGGKAKHGMERNQALRFSTDYRYRYHRMPVRKRHTGRNIRAAIALARAPE